MPLLCPQRNGLLDFRPWVIHVDFVLPSEGLGEPLLQLRSQPLSQHPAPLADGQVRPRPPLAVGSEQRASLVEAVAGE